MEQIYEILSDDEDMIGLIIIIDHPRILCQFRNRENQFENWSDVEFFQRFRLSKNTVNFVLQTIQYVIASPTEMNHAASAAEMLLVTLRFYATGSFLQVCGEAK
ncbi:hypothetical protein NQ318_022610 [Aromia moschata]|uniref:Uncharacterized protein n=1 Tax=Aromia moschata TaxID=1265417 RepID=A0AAV8XD39_9CUCU|nr:hypothetical protein NQ318_022610 [Aromia moschata]